MVLKNDWSDGDLFSASDQNAVAAAVNDVGSAVAGKADVVHTHTPADISTTGASEGWVLTRGPGGVAGWAAVGGGAPGVAVSGKYQSGAPNNAGPVVTPTIKAASQTKVGSGTAGSGQGVTLIGFEATGGTGGYESAVGAYAKAGSLGAGGTAIGAGAEAMHTHSSALGRFSKTTKAFQVMLGTTSEVVTIPNKVEVGTGAAMVTLSTRITAGKAELIAQFATGTPIVIATEPA